MKMYIHLKYFTLHILINSALGYTSHNALDSIIFTTNMVPSEDIHSEYYFGKCASQERALIVKHTYQFKDIKNKLVTRVRLLVKQEPSCVYIRAKSEFSEIIKYHAFKFNICICRLLYVYGGRIFSHFYYEWYTPVEMMNEIVWSLYFYK